MAALTEEIRAFLRDPVFVHLAMLREDGSPQVAVVWADVDDRDPDRINISTGKGSPKIACLERDPRVALSATRLNDPYDEVYIRGRVVEFRTEGAPERMQQISHKYTGKPFPWPVENQVTVVIAVDKATHRKLPFEPPAAMRS